jgi:hypothetical protein
MKWKLIKYVLIFSIFNLNVLYCQNASVCVEMYRNNSISVPCVKNSSCCYIQYSYYNTTDQKCLLKKNATDDYCKNLEGPISYYYGSLNMCDCVAGFIKNNWYVSISLSVLLLISINIF